MKFDDILVELGEFGRFQKWIYFMTCIITIPGAMVIGMVIFLLDIPNHRCALPMVPNDTYAVQGPWHAELINRSIPRSKVNDGYSQCDVIIYANHSSASASNTSRCSRWVYSKEDFLSTVVTDLDLVCDDVSLSTHANMISIAGTLTGVPIFGMLGDAIGRKKILVIALLSTTVLHLATAFANSFISFVILRFLSMWFGSSVYGAAFVIALELVGPSKRRQAGILIAYPFCFGLLLLAMLAYFIRHWRYLQIALAVTDVSVLWIVFLLPESARWLICKGRYQEAAAIIKRASVVNKVTLSDQASNLENLDVEAGIIEKFWTMFKSRTLAVRCFIIFYNWTAANMVYTGLLLNTNALSGNIYLNFTLSSIAEGVSYGFCFIVLDRVGRRFLQCFSMFVAGIACFGAVVNTLIGNGDLGWVTVVLTLVGKFGSSAAFAVIFIFTAELFPTSMRNTGIGVSLFFSQISGLVVPYIVDINKFISGDIGIVLPMIIFGACSMLAAFLALFLPETTGTMLPETVEDAKNFGKKKKTREQNNLPTPATDVKKAWHTNGDVNTGTNEGVTNIAFRSTNL